MGDKIAAKIKGSGLCPAERIWAEYRYVKLWSERSGGRVQLAAAQQKVSVAVGGAVEWACGYVCTIQRCRGGDLAPYWPQEVTLAAFCSHDLVLWCQGSRFFPEVRVNSSVFCKALCPIKLFL